MTTQIIVLIIGIAIGIAVGIAIKLAEIKALKQRDNDNRVRIADLQMAVEHERDEARRSLDDYSRRWHEQLQSVKSEIIASSAYDLARRQGMLQESNRAQLDSILTPIKEKFTEFRDTLERSRINNEASRRTMQAQIDATFKLFSQQQEQSIQALLNATMRIGNDAQNLTRALKADPKKQGNWGELVLETLLENSGLRRDEEYFVQPEYKDKRGRSARPDVVVRFPEGRCVVVDSKVSLTSYAESVATEDDDERERLLRDHVESVRRHVNELAERDYTSIVDDAIGFVLMFIPNESAYIAAIKHSPGLSNEAYTKHVIILSPANLLMALQLAYNLWQNDRQNKNVERITVAAADLYDKVVGFEEVFLDIDNRLNQLRSSFETARSRLYTGRGSVVDRLNQLKALGVTPKKRLKGSADSTPDSLPQSE